MERRKLMVVTAVLGLIGLIMPAVAEEPVWTPQTKLMAARAARLDAMRKLAERIKGFQIRSDTSVRDFVTENDQIETALNTFLKGVREVGKAKYYDDGTCEVTLEVTLAKVIATLKSIHNRYYKGDRIKVNDFNKIVTRREKKILKAVGSGAAFAAPPAEELDPDQIVEQPAVRSNIPPLWRKLAAPNCRLLAYRAARVDAMRKLAERVRGFRITSNTTVRDFVAENDEINVRLSTFLRGVREERVYYHPDELICEVRLAITLKEVVATLKTIRNRYYKGSKIRINDFNQLTKRNRRKIIRETGMGVPPARCIRTVIEATAVEEPDWITKTLSAVGQGAIDPDEPNEAKAKLMAARAAELDAKRKLAEQVMGFRITSDTTVADFVAEHDEIQTDLDAFIQGAQVVKTQYTQDGAEVTVKMPMLTLWRTVKVYWRDAAN